jgi:arginase
VTTILAPYHLEEQLHYLDLPADRTIIASFPSEEADPWARLATLYDSVAAAVSEIVRAGGRPTVVSGDCTTSLGTMAGLQRAELDPAIVWFDAHGDVQTPETTSSGYLGGMPLRLLVGHRRDLIADRLGLREVAEGRVVLVGARELDPPEDGYLAAAAIRRSPVAELTAEMLPPGPLYLHLDVDVVDSGELPGLRYPAAGGPSLDAVGEALRRVLATGRVAAVGVACTWHAGHDAQDRIRPLLP